MNNEYRYLAVNCRFVGPKREIGSSVISHRLAMLECETQEDAEHVKKALIEISYRFLDGYFKIKRELSELDTKFKLDRFGIRRGFIKIYSENEKIKFLKNISNNSQKLLSHPRLADIKMAPLYCNSRNLPIIHFNDIDFMSENYNVKQS